MSAAQIELETLPQEVRTLLACVPAEYLRDLALDLAGEKERDVCLKQPYSLS